MARRSIDQQEQYQVAADRIVRDAVRQFDAHEVGHFVLASGEHSPEKIDMDKVWGHEPIRRVVGELLAYLPSIPKTDVLIGVPHGGKRWAEIVHEISWIPHVRLCKLPEKGRGVFDFMSDADRELAENAASATIIEDVVYRGGSAAAVRKMLPNECEVDLRAVWNRGEMAEANTSVFRSAQFLVTQTLMAYAPDACPDHGEYTQ